MKVECFETYKLEISGEQADHLLRQLTEHPPVTVQRCDSLLPVVFALNEVRRILTKEEIGKLDK